MPVQIDQPTVGALQETLTRPVILDARLPQMAQGTIQPPPVSAAAQKMPDQPVAKAIAGAQSMKAVDPGVRVDQPVSDKLGEMQGHPEVAEAGNSNQSYIRLRVRATGNDIKVLSAHEVDGPLIAPSTIVGQHAYEVTLDAKTIATEGIADLGEQRSFARPGTNEHFITERQSVEFNVRIPKSSLPDAALSRVGVTLYRFPDASARVLQGRISAQPGLQARPIAQLQSLKVESLEPELHQQLQRIFPKLTVTPR